ncbi:MAG: valine--tRNA ligase [Candidatus Micrarchaeota archaeon]|nr:valine--tRNA ligase [Candidatus Micrarchaeota archaeon]
MALDKLDSKAIEAKLVAKWRELGLHEFDAKGMQAKPVYSIDSPPPFTSGALHMGHMLSYSYFDFAARYKRMRGFNVYYPQGWDCQGFPTEVKVEKKYGWGKLSRKEFKKKCVEFTEQNIVAMKSQMDRMGFSPDWRHEYRTMDADYHRRVQHSLLDMFEKGEVYHAKHPVLFCTHCRSAIAKAESDDAERETKLNYVVFGSDAGDLLIATTRPEYLHACVAVFVHPSDERYKHLVGKSAVVPLFGKKVPIMADADVDKEFGTGIVMVCTFGDKTDVAWAYRHKLPIVHAMNEDGRLANAGPYEGLSTVKGREKILEDLAAKGLLKKQEPLKQVIKVHDRCEKPTEYILSTQWFVKIKGREKEVIEAAKKMKWIPAFAIQYLVDWCEFIEYDWVISRQRVYGTPLPFWYCEKCGKVFAPERKSLPVDPAEDEAPAEKCGCGGKVVAETSVCDCWVDSSITPLVIGKWPDDQKFLDRVYPSSLRPQGLEIIRTWAFYTIARCLSLTGKPCFKEVLINGSVLGTDGKKMSKSAGNYEDPEVLLAKYPADALRQWAALSGAFAKDRPFSYKDVEFGQAFITKLWNASKFVEKAVAGYEQGDMELRVADKWILSRLARVVEQCTAALDEYDYYNAMTAVHSFFWHEFCDYYLEDVKHRVYQAEKFGAESKRGAQYALSQCLSTILKLMAPVVAFTSDEIYRGLFAEKEKTQSLHACAWPAPAKEYINQGAENIAKVLHEVVSGARRFKASKQLSLNEEISSAKISASPDVLKAIPEIEADIKAIGKIGSLELAAGKELAVEFAV